MNVCVSVFLFNWRFINGNAYDTIIFFRSSRRNEDRTKLACPNQSFKETAVVVTALICIHWVFMTAHWLCNTKVGTDGSGLCCVPIPLFTFRSPLFGFFNLQPEAGLIEFVVLNYTREQIWRHVNGPSIAYLFFLCVIFTVNRPERQEKNHLDQIWIDFILN